MITISHISRVLTVFLLLTLVLIPGSLVSAEGATAVSVSGPQEVNPGKQFTIDILVEPEAAIAGMQFGLAFDSSLLTVDSVAEGNLLSQNGATAYFSPGTIDNISGSISGVAGAITTPGQVISTPGTFAVITLTASMSGGTSPLTLSNVVAGDIDGQPVQVNTVSGQVAINSNASVLPPLPTGGLGGGGGGGGDNTNVTESINSEGRFTEDVDVKSADRKVLLHIPQDTVGLNRMGRPLYYVSIGERKPLPPPPPNGQIVGQVYELGPTGTTFEPYIDFIFEYDDAEVPQGVAEKNLVLSTYDWDAEQWQDLESMVDMQNKTVKIQVSHFSTFAVLAYTRPASFEITDFTLNSHEVLPGEPVTFSVLVTNTGDLTGSYDVSLKLDEAIIAIKTVTLIGGDSETVSFSITPTAVGEHIASIGNLSASFTINEPSVPSTFVTSNLGIYPTEIDLGASISVSILITNSGDLPGIYNAVLHVDDIEVESKEIALVGGEGKDVSFNFTPEGAGLHTVTMGGLQATFMVQTPALIEKAPVPGVEINDFRVTPILDMETNKLMLTRIEYQLNGPREQIAQSTLTLKISYEGELLDEIQLLSLNQPFEGNVGSYGYVPSAGWKTGLYDFQVELYDGQNSIQAEQKQFTVTAEAIAAVVNWKILGIIIGAALIVAVFVVAIVLVRRRDMLRT